MRLKNKKGMSAWWVVCFSLSTVVGTIWWAADTATAETPGFKGHWGLVETGGGGGSPTYGDDTKLEFGDAPDCWYQWSSTEPQFELECTDIDGGGTNGVVWSVDNGTDDVDFTGDVVIDGDSGSSLCLAPDCNERISADSATIRFRTATTERLRLDNTFFNIFSTVVRVSGGLTGASSANPVQLGGSGCSPVQATGGDDACVQDDFEVLGATLSTEAKYEGMIEIDCDDDGYTIPATAHTIVVDDDAGVACTGNMDLTLPVVSNTPATQSAQREICVKRVGSTSAVVIDGNGAETIDGAATHTLSAQWDYFCYQDYAGTNTDWIIK